jgi:hypothetical protein
MSHFLRYLPQIALVIVLLPALFACGTSENIDLKSANVINIPNPKADINTAYKASDVYDHVELIPLETREDCLVGQVTKIMINRGLIYVMDDTALSVSIFDMNGKLTGKIERLGRGSQEYISISDFTVTAKGDVMVLDGQRKTIICYDTRGSFRYSQQIPFYADALACLNDSTIVFNGSSHEARVLVWDQNSQKLINKYLDYSIKHSARILKPLMTYNGEVYFTQEFSSVIYNVRQDGMDAKWFVDFGERNFRDSEIVQTEFGFYIAKPNIIQNMSLFTDTDDYITFKFECEELNDLPLYVYNSKVTGQRKILNVDNYDDDILFNKYPPYVFDATTDGRFFGVIYPFYLAQNNAEYDTSKMDTSTLNNWNALHAKLKDVGEYDNPIVAIYTLKPF